MPVTVLSPRVFFIYVCADRMCLQCWSTCRIERLFKFHLIAISISYPKITSCSRELSFGTTK